MAKVRVDKARWKDRICKWNDFAKSEQGVGYINELGGQSPNVC